MSRALWTAVSLAVSSLAVSALAVSSLAPPPVHAQASLYETEPNNTPAEATPVSGEAILIGTMEGSDQDAFQWSVSDVEAQKRWTFELEGIPGALTIVEVLQVEFADNGVDVTDRTKLFTIGSRDGTRPARAKDLIFEPGEYILGLAFAAGSAGYRPPVDRVSFDGPGSGSEGEGAPKGGYRLSIRQGSRLLLNASPADNETLAKAAKTRLGAEQAAFTENLESWFRLEINDKARNERWDVNGQVPVGRQARVFLRTGDGNELTRTATDRFGQFALRDLGLEAGTYYLEMLGTEGGSIRALATASVGQRIDGAEAEPNDTWKLANRADPTRPVTGRAGARGERDYFQIRLSPEFADRELELALETEPGSSFELCLLDAQGAHVQCRSGEGSVVLPDLVLTPGSWGILVDRGGEGAAYSVTLQETGPIQQGREAEPNDSAEWATAVPANNRIKGRFVGTDTDFYRLIVTDDPQLWRFQVMGDSIHELAYHDSSGIQSLKIRAPQGQSRVRLDNVFLLPGEHHVRVSGIGDGDYTLLARPLGPPDPNGEFEPNDDTTRMQPLRFGQTRTGLLEDAKDVDYYRFYLGHWDRIRLTLEPPADGEIQAHLWWDSSSTKQYNQPVLGQKVELEGLFPPGDYQLALNAKTPSEAEYTVSLERLDRFGCPTDCEPNDTLDLASPLPPDHVVEGRVGEWRGTDWYRLPLFDRPTGITVSSESRKSIEVVTREYAAKSFAEWDHEAGVWRGTIPAGVQTYLHVKGQSEPAYRLKIDLEGIPASPSGQALLPIELGIALETTEVAAYRQHGQRVGGELRLVNSGANAVALELDAATSDYRWRLELAEERVTVPARGTKSVPLTLSVPVDAWADRPVRVSIRARGEAGAQQETDIEISAGRETSPVNLVHGWSLPDELLGGFNVAWSALGGRWTGQEDSAIGKGFADLFDGMAVEGYGVYLRGGTKVETIDVTVELAGSEPVEVAGFALNPLSGRYATRFLRNVDLALSLDGQSFTPVIESQLLPLRDEQSFVLETPIAARYARVQLKNASEGSAKPPITMGEVKVIGRPGVDITGGRGFNLAEPALGGHVVWSRPSIWASTWDTGVLRDDDRPGTLRFRGQRQEFVIGFHHDRAAQISRVEWLDTAGSQPEFGKVALSISTESPTGPWQPIGELNLADASSLAILNLAEPVWGRFVKFSASRDAESGAIEAPAQVRIWERPTDADYRSILSEWGWGSQKAIYEYLTPLLREEELRISGNNSRATAQLLPLSKRVRGQVALGKEVDWYGVVMPEGENTLTVTLGGEPTVRTVAHLENDAGEPIPLRDLSTDSTPDLHTFEAVVEPGGTYYLKVEEPPRNVVFIWDTSASVGAYLPVIYNSLTAYAEDLVPGRDAANLMPFGSSLLLRDWYGEPYILQTVINDYPRSESSSEAEQTLANATEALAPLAGTKAIVVITDAATNYYPAVWEKFERVAPRVFGLGLSSIGAFGRNPAREQDLFQDWSRVNGGHYTHLKSEGEMEIAFDRVATLLRRPAPYTLEVASAFREAPGPGTLAVVSTGTAEPAASGAVELILDASGSMLKRLDGKRRIEVARDVLTQVVTEQLPAGTPLALRVFGHKEASSCRTDLEIPLQPLDQQAAARVIASVNAKNLAKTPIAASLEQVASDLEGAKGKKVVVLVTDGEETCDGDAEAVIRQLQDQGIDVRLNIVGFAIGDGELEEQFQDWAELAGGRYFSAGNQDGLSEALEKALRVPYAIYDAGGTLVGEGAVNGEPIELDQGFYRVVVDTAPKRTFERVEVPGETETVLEVETASRASRTTQ